MYNRKLDGLAVLCESKEKVDIDKVPPEILPMGGTQTWPIVIVSETPVEATTTDVQSDTVSEKSEREGCLKTLLASSEGSPEAIIHAVGDLLAKTEKPAGEGSSYRHLRIFSGAIPTPAGEEFLENWLEQAHLMVEESECSTKEKR